MNMISWLNGPNGEKSSKRLLGTIAMLAGVAVYVALAIYGFIAQVPHIEAVRGAALGLTASGAGLLGFGTLAERMGK